MDQLSIFPGEDVNRNVNDDINYLCRVDETDEVLCHDTSIPLEQFEKQVLKLVPQSKLSKKVRESLISVPVLERCNEITLMGNLDRETDYEVIISMDKSGIINYNITYCRHKRTLAGERAGDYGVNVIIKKYNGTNAPQEENE